MSRIDPRMIDRDFCKISEITTKKLNNLFSRIRQYTWNNQYRHYPKSHLCDILLILVTDKYT